MRLYIGVIGPGSGATPEEINTAHEVGELLAEAGHVVVTGGLDGVMEAASRGAFEAGGTSVGLLPGRERVDGNRYLTVSIPTGMGEMRNALLVRTADAIICVGGSWGTLSELALAVRTAVPVVVLDGWDLPVEGPTSAKSAAEAVSAVERLCGECPEGAHSAPNPASPTDRV